MVISDVIHIAVGSQRALYHDAKGYQRHSTLGRNLQNPHHNTKLQGGLLFMLVMILNMFDLRMNNQ